ncbi:MAG: LytTR family transcriptional regulator DNA-binding domain-containing protein [Chitinophagales bacterium]|nr:LytTR family transcriptional regulator DNA-binding domain-containing protein [Chitinophagales bacterium]
MSQESSVFVLPLLKGNFAAMDVNEIKYFKSDGPVVYIVIEHEQQLIGSQSLRFYMNMLSGESFFQVSQSILVNLKKVKYIDVVNQELELHCGKRLSASRNGMKMLKEYIRDHQYKW